MRARPNRSCSDVTPFGERRHRVLPAECVRVAPHSGEGVFPREIGSPSPDSTERGREASDAPPHVGSRCSCCDIRAARRRAWHVAESLRLGTAFVAELRTMSGRARQGQEGGSQERRAEPGAGDGVWPDGEKGASVSSSPRATGGVGRNPEIVSSGAEKCSAIRPTSAKPLAADLAYTSAMIVLGQLEIDHASAHSVRPS